MRTTTSHCARLGLATLLAASCMTVPSAADASSADCKPGERIRIAKMHFIFMKVRGTTITFENPGTHSVEITKATALSAKYGTRNADDQADILAAVQRKRAATRDRVPITTGHKFVFETPKGLRDTLSYASLGFWVRWQKVDVSSDCERTVVEHGIAKLPTHHRDWLRVTTNKKTGYTLRSFGPPQIA